jgi:hypothetical protein
MTNTMIHLTTDPACVHHRAPSNWLAWFWFESNRGKACGRCQLDRWLAVHIPPSAALAPAPASVKWPAAPGPVHNHGPEDGAGLLCREYPTLSGRLRGACLDQPRERWRYLYRTDGWTGPLDVWELVANPGDGRQVGNLVAVSVRPA